jgi:hypothetical protein
LASQGRQHMLYVGRAPAEPCYSISESQKDLRCIKALLLIAQYTASHGNMLDCLTFWQRAPHLGVELSVANSRPAALDALRPLGPAPTGPTPSPLVPMPAFCFCPSVGVRLPAGGSGKPGKKPEWGQHNTAKYCRKCGSDDWQSQHDTAHTVLAFAYTPVPQVRMVGARRQRESAHAPADASWTRSV